MSEKITALLEAIVSKKPADAREVFDSIMVEKLRSVVESHRDVVAENLFADHKAEVEESDLDEDYEDEGEVLEEGRRGALDKTAARELKLYTDNDSHLYHQAEPIRRNLMNHHARGRYDHELAAVGWGHHVKRAADKYAQEFGGLGERGHHIFNKRTRDHVAKMMADEFRDDHLRDAD